MGCGPAAEIGLAEMTRTLRLDENVSARLTCVDDDALGVVGVGGTPLDV